MSFLDNLTKKVGDAAKVAAKRSEGFMETTKLNMAISSDEGRIKAIYNQLGELTYNKFKAGEISDGELAALCLQIREIENNIAELKEKIEEIRLTKDHETAESSYTPPASAEEKKFCSSCGAEVSAGAKFCSSCGTSL
ncbi:double zinc ribbon [Oxobacter pfennigii]|uniref:Double zinc ribbon n=1 Tax=Oxobacter pfennigii TaxID=36849 RepID=A0A0P8X2T4_9CLOT|nr:zinc ribbon domain-containing protein [Oxobacter pfennigii]KPU45106.1 double zinc ribbon [Oxobacter pfennigii]